MAPPTSVDPTIHDAARAISIPKEGAADSFVLHAPLELVARVGILERLAPRHRPAALRRIASLVGEYEAAGPPVPTPPVRSHRSLDEAAADLAAALATGDLDAVDAIAASPSLSTDAAAVRAALGSSIVASLGAAGHAPIGLHLLDRVAGGSLPPGLLRGPLREVARHPDWRLTWFDTDPGVASGGLEPDRCGLEDRLRAVPHLGIPGSSSIHPLMSQAETSGAAQAVIAPARSADLAPVARILLRTAAWSMLHDDPAHAPYGWTHCLTMPQAVLSLAPDAVDPATAIAVAGTFVVGFRAALGARDLGDLGDEAADPDDTDIAAALVAASVHPDAHLAKYVLACCHAAEDDHAWQGTYHRAAAHLVEWWRRAG